MSRTWRRLRGGADVDSAKGLEFDYVVVPDATADAYPLTDEGRRRLHVAVTRAAHQVWLLASGRPSPIVCAPGGVFSAHVAAPREQDQA